jgi:hypothetical protein
MNSSSSDSINQIINRVENIHKPVIKLKQNFVFHTLIYVIINLDYN